MYIYIYILKRIAVCCELTLYGAAHLLSFYKVTVYKSSEEISLCTKILIENGKTLQNLQSLLLKDEAVNALVCTLFSLNCKYSSSACLMEARFIDFDGCGSVPA